MTTIKNITLEELLHAINILGDDRDVSVDGIDTVAVCPPVEFTPEGKEHFKQALAANVVVEYKTRHRDTYVSDDDEKTNELAWDLLMALAGYCNANGYDRWFSGEEAEMI